MYLPFYRKGINTNMSQIDKAKQEVFDYVRLMLGDGALKDVARDQWKAVEVTADGVSWIKILCCPGWSQTGRSGRS